ncbi:MAG: bifunctional 3,4-dihydroxy-2-butanone-4-phosphate synthase/GTP cyclohydrolase II [Candidatus Omnitrophica bacterium]|nr:bifunctional 3,4-dihydroxy-2-butanone-4-phosphate synthase/GTP cyclohydrolase II [Candidatus Omnitrophota bacterium]
MAFCPVEELIAEVKQGRMIIVTDDESRENEGDLILAAHFTSPENINFMMKHARGLICIPMTDSRLQNLGLRDMVDQSDDSMRTAFTVSVDAKHGVTTGISAHDRSRTIEVLADLKYSGNDIVTPGHVFPLRAKRGGVLRRSGHTEAAIDLMRLAGLNEVAIICEIINDDGSMARLPDLEQFAATHGFKMGTIADLISYRRMREKLVEFVAEADIPTKFGMWHGKLYRSLIDQKEHMALIFGKIDETPQLVRVHSECFTGDVLGSMRCDCRAQLNAAMENIAKEGRGVLLYIRQEGRGIGLANKLKAYALQDQGYDTVEANEKLGFRPDLRDYGIGAQILKDLGLSKIRLLTNNPKKIIGLEGHGLQVVERIHMDVQLHELNRDYVQTKREKLGHF